MAEALGLASSIFSITSQCQDVVSLIDLRADLRNQEVQSIKQEIVEIESLLRRMVDAVQFNPTLLSTAGVDNLRIALESLDIILRVSKKVLDENLYPQGKFMMAFRQESLKKELQEHRSRLHANKLSLLLLFQ